MFPPPLLPKKVRRWHVEVETSGNLDIGRMWLVSVGNTLLSGVIAFLEGFRVRRMGWVDRSIRGLVSMCLGVLGHFFNFLHHLD